MSSMDNEDRFAPPRAAVDDLPEAVDGQVLASRWARLGGALIDTVIVLVALWVISLVTPWNPFDPARADFMRFAPLNALLGFILFLVLHGYPLFTAGQTWGKKVVGTRIVRSDGSRVDAARLIGLRYGVPTLFGVVPALHQLFGLVNVLFIFRASRRCLHDSIADTIVIKA
jgi:uncharacterized RDD family membrane protein YckC